MVELKVRKFGNSLGVLLPKEVIARLNTKAGAPLYLVEAPDNVIAPSPLIRSSRPRWRRPKASSAATAIRSTRWRSS